MSRKLLPSSAAAFNERAKPILVLKSGCIAPWLTERLKILNKERNERTQDKRKLNSGKQVLDYLAELLSSETALWTLCEFTPGAVARAETIQVQAYIVCIDDVWSNEMSFKLTPDTILSLEELHRQAFLPNDEFNSTKELEGNKLKMNEPRIRAHLKFSRAINDLVYHTNVRTLMGLNENGSGELLADERKVAEELMLSHFEDKLASFHAEQRAPLCSSLALTSVDNPLQREEDNHHLSLNTEYYGGSYHGGIDPISDQIQTLWPSELVGYQQGPPDRTLPPHFPRHAADNVGCQHIPVKSSPWDLCKQPDSSF